MNLEVLTKKKKIKNKGKTDCLTIRMYMYILIWVLSLYGCSLDEYPNLDSKNTVLFRTFNKELKLDQNLFPNAVSLETYGAIGDGLNDDGSAIQKAIDSEKPVRFGSNKIYRITSTLILKSGSILYSDGIASDRSTILMDTRFFNNTSPGYFTNSAPYVKKNAVGISGHGVKNIHLSGLEIRPGFDTGARFMIGLSVRASQNIRIEKNLFTGFSWASGIISLDTVKDVVIH